MLGYNDNPADGYQPSNHVNRIKNVRLTISRKNAQLAKLMERYQAMCPAHYFEMPDEDSEYFEAPPTRAEIEKEKYISKFDLILAAEQAEREADLKRNPRWTI
jgi:hypothetical protein